MCLHKILHIIASSKTPSSTLRSSTSRGGLGIDLNLRLCSSTSTGSLFRGNEEEEGEERVVGFVDESDSCSVKKIFQGEREKETDKEEKDGGRRIVLAGEEEEEEEEEEKDREREREQAQEEGGSEITNLQGFQNDDDDDDVVSAKKSIEGHASKTRRTNNDGFLGLLVEAARLVSGDNEAETETESKGRPSQRGERSESTRTEQGARAEVEEGEEEFGDYKESSTSATAEAEAEAEAVRGRTRRRQVLPHRLRDSVLLLEPWMRLSRSNRV